jgi:hypothetical protein
MRGKEGWVRNSEKVQVPTIFWYFPTPFLLSVLIPFWRQITTATYSQRYFGFSKKPPSCSAVAHCAHGVQKRMALAAPPDIRRTREHSGGNTLLHHDSALFATINNLAYNVHPHNIILSTFIYSSAWTFDQCWLKFSSYLLKIQSIIFHIFKTRKFVFVVMNAYS